MSNQNIFKNAAEILYKDEKKKKKEKELRNSLISELGDEIEPKHVLYASNEELMKMKDEKNKKNNNSKVPLPGNNSDEELYFLKDNSEINKTNENDKKETPRNDIKEGETEINGVKLKDKIPMKRKEKLSVSAKISPELYLDDNELEDDINQDEATNKNDNTTEDKNIVQLQNVKSNSDKNNNGIFSAEEIKQAREFIAESEGFRDVAYQDSKGVWTIGYGHTGMVDGKPITKGMKISKEKAEELYSEDFINHIKPLEKIQTKLTKNQKIALASLIYNVGASGFLKSNMYKKIQAGDIEGAANELDDWDNITVNGVKRPIKGLTIRRKKEKELFLRPDEN